MITTAQSIPETRTDELSDLINRKGTPLYPDKNGIPSIVNQSFFAAYTIHSLGLKRDHGSNWRHYNPETGLWNKVPPAELLRLISSQLLDFSRKNNVPSLAAKRSASLCREILSFMDGESSEAFLLPMRRRNVIHTGNGMVEIAPDGSMTFRPFAREYYSCTRTPYQYDPEAKCPNFLNKLLAPCMSQDDIDCLQLYVGQCLLGVNLAQMFMMLTGTPGSGKSTLVNVIEKLISRENCTELRLEQMAERFEMNRLRGKTLLTGKDVKSYFLTSRGAYKLKALIGGDVLTTEAKGSNEAFDIPGEFNVIITANSNLTVDIDSDN